MYPEKHTWQTKWVSEKNLLMTFFKPVSQTFLRTISTGMKITAMGFLSRVGRQGSFLNATKENGTI